MSKDSKIASSLSSNRSRRGLQKKVVSVPIKDVERFNAPPPDSWAWRKYGQKPIKGSPYPRGYYRCSSSKGCPARKQVERSRVNPKMVVVTYSFEHNHALPVSRNNHHRTSVPHNTSLSISEEEYEEDEDDDEEEEEEEKKPNRNSIPSKSEDREELISEDDKFTNIVEGEFDWYPDFETSMLESPILTGGDSELMDTIFTVREEDESLFADLGELPECSMVFRRGLAEAAMATSGC